MKIKLVVLSLFFSVIVFPQQKYGSDLLLNFAAPIGKYAKYFNPGIGVTWGFYYDVESNIRLGFSIGFIRIGADDEEIENYYRSAVSQSDLSMTGSVSTIPINFTFKIISPGKTNRFYGAFEAGLYTYWTKANGTYTNNGESVTLDKSEFRSEAGFSMGVGTLFKLEETLWLDVNVKYQFIQDSEYLYVDEDSESISTSRLLIIGAGLNWSFDLNL